MRERGGERGKEKGKEGSGPYHLSERGCTPDTVCICSYGQHSASYDASKVQTYIVKPICPKSIRHVSP